MQSTPCELVAQAGRLALRFDSSLALPFGFGWVCRAASMARSKRFQPSGSGDGGDLSVMAGSQNNLKNALYSTAPSDTVEGQERERQFFEALGRFVVKFADVESTVSMVLWRYAKTTRTIGAHIFSSVKIDHGSTLIKQLAAALGSTQEKRDDLDNVLQQLGVINGMRNNILHHGVDSIAEDKPTVSNWLRAKGEPFEMVVPPEMLDLMRADLRKISAHLLINHLERAMPQSEDGRALFEQILRDPWRYRPPPQPPSQTKTQASRPKKARPAARIDPPKS